jgi:hypothetical protein
VREGVYTLIFRIGEQNRNLAKILFRKGAVKEGALLAKDLLQYLLSGHPGKLTGSIFSERRYWEEVPYVREGYAYDYFRGMVTQLVYLENQSPEEMTGLFDDLFGDVDVEVTTPDRLIIYNWLYLKTTFRAGAYSEFVEALITFMSEPMSQLYDILKISLFRDVKLWLKKSNFNAKEELSLKIRHHLDEKLNIYEEFRDKVEKSKFTLNDFRIPFPGSE